MMLYDPNSASIYPAYLEFARKSLKPVVEKPSQSAHDFLAANGDYQAHPSPLLAHWIYQAATVVLRLNAQTGEDFGNFDHLTQRLDSLGQRWIVAGLFLKLDRHA